MFFKNPTQCSHAIHLSSTKPMASHLTFTLVNIFRIQSAASTKGTFSIALQFSYFAMCQKNEVSSAVTVFRRYHIEAHWMKYLMTACWFRKDQRKVAWNSSLASVRSFRLTELMKRASSEWKNYFGRFSVKQCLTSLGSAGIASSVRWLMKQYRISLRKRMKCCNDQHAAAVTWRTFGPVFTYKLRGCAKRLAFFAYQ